MILRERTRRSREVKDPAVRKKEILDGAMELFTQQGYEALSMRDIAAYLHISLGLCYRYFDSKHILFEEAMSQYISEYCAQYLTVLHDPTYDIMEKIEFFFQQSKKESEQAKYHTFFHRPENLALHEELGIKICRYMTPHIEQEVAMYLAKTHQRLRHPATLIRFLTYGQIGLQAGMPNEDILQDLKHYFTILLEHELIPDE